MFHEKELNSDIVSLASTLVGRFLAWSAAVGSALFVIASLIVLLQNNPVLFPFSFMMGMVSATYAATNSERPIFQLFFGSSLMVELLMIIATTLGALHPEVTLLKSVAWFSIFLCLPLTISLIRFAYNVERYIRKEASELGEV